MYANGIWGIERLEGERNLAGLAVLTPPAPSGGPEGLPEVEMKRKKKKDPPKKPVDVIVQPEVKKEDEKKIEPLVGDNGGGGDTTGTGTNPDGKPDDTGTCSTPPCGPSGGDGEKKVEPPPKKKTEWVAPPTMSHLRTWGDPQIHAPLVVKHEMRNDGRNRVVGVVKLCISETGAITSVTLQTSTKYPEYDEKLLAGVRTWRYRPHVINGVAVPICSTVSFGYTMQ